jgi:hypothetical protein
MGKSIRAIVTFFSLVSIVLGTPWLAIQSAAQAEPGVIRAVADGSEEAASANQRVAEAAGEPVQPYLFKLPHTIEVSRVSGLDVVFEVQQTEANESYYIDLFALKDLPGSKQEIRLGGQAVFKPLAKGQKTTVYLEAPPQAAWIRHDGELELWIEWRVSPAHPQRAAPKVKLRIQGVVATTR